MIIRIVKLTFQPEKADDFTGIFSEQKKNILAFDGCMHMELWKAANCDNVFFTYSKWRDSTSLEHYRNSDFFRSTWARAKALFSEKAEAWSVTVADI